MQGWWINYEIFPLILFFRFLTIQVSNTEDIQGHAELVLITTALQSWMNQLFHVYSTQAVKYTFTQAVQCTLTGCTMSTYRLYNVPLQAVQCTLTGCTMSTYRLYNVHLQAVQCTLTGCTMYTYRLYNVPLQAVQCSLTGCIQCTLTGCIIYTYRLQ